MFKFILGRLENSAFRSLVITRFVYDITIDIDEVVILECRLGICDFEEIIGNDCHTLSYGSLQNLFSVICSLGTDAVCKHFIGFLFVRKFLVWQEGCHSQLGIGR